MFLWVGGQICSSPPPLILKGPKYAVSNRVNGQMCWTFTRICNQVLSIVICDAHIPRSDSLISQFRIYMGTIPPGSNRVKVPPFSPGLAEDAGEASLLWGFKEGGDQISLQWLKLSFYSFRFVSFRADYATQFFMVFLYKMQYQEKIREKWQFTAPQLFWSMGSIANLLARANIKHTLGRKK